MLAARRRRSAAPFDPLRVGGLGLWFDSEIGVDTTSAAFAGTGTVTIAAGTATFTASQDGTLRIGSTVTVGANAHVVSARTSGTVWTVSGPNEGAGSAFTVTHAFPRVTQWNDRAGAVAARNFAQATASSQPLWKPDGSTYGLDTDQDQLTGSAAVLTLANAIRALTCFYVVRIDDFTGSQQTLFRILSSGQTLYSLQVNNGKNAGILSRRVNTDATISNFGADGKSLAVGEWGVICGILDYVNAKASVYSHGVARVENQAVGWASGPGLTPAVNADSIMFMSNAPTTNNIVGSSRACLVWPRALLADERRAVTHWLARKYALILRGPG